MPNLGYALGEGAETLSKTLGATLNYRYMAQLQNYQMGLEAAKMDLQKQQAAINNEAMRMQMAESAHALKVSQYNLRTSQDIKETAEELAKTYEEEQTTEGPVSPQQEARRKATQTALRRRLAIQRGEDPLVQEQKLLAGQQDIETAAAQEEALGAEAALRRRTNPNLRATNEATAYIDKYIQLADIPEEKRTPGQQAGFKALDSYFSKKGTPKGLMKFEDLPPAQQGVATREFQKIKTKWQDPSLEGNAAHIEFDKDGKVKSIKPFPYQTSSEWYNALIGATIDVLGVLEDTSGIGEEVVPAGNNDVDNEFNTIMNGLK